MHHPPILTGIGGLDAIGPAGGTARRARRAARPVAARPPRRSPATCTAPRSRRSAAAPSRPARARTCRPKLEIGSPGFTIVHEPPAFLVHTATVAHVQPVRTIPRCGSSARRGVQPRERHADRTTPPSPPPARRSSSPPVAGAVRVPDQANRGHRKVGRRQAQRAQHVVGHLRGPRCATSTASPGARPNAGTGSMRQSSRSVRRAGGPARAEGRASPGPAPDHAPLRAERFDGGAAGAAGSSRYVRLKGSQRTPRATRRGRSSLTLGSGRWPSWCPRRGPRRERQLLEPGDLLLAEPAGRIVGAAGPAIRRGCGCGSAARSAASSCP